MQIEPKFIKRQEICGRVDAKCLKPKVIVTNVPVQTKDYFLSMQGVAFFIKGTASVILSNPLCKNGNARFTNVPLKLCLIKYELDIQIYNLENCIFLLLVSPQK